MIRLYLPTDEITGKSINFDLAADFLELTAFFAEDSNAFTSDLANQTSLGAASDHTDIQDELLHGEEEVVSGSVNRIEERRRSLGCAYPFEIDEEGTVLTCVFAEDAVEHAAYILSLVLSNLRSMTPLLDSSGLHPDDHEVVQLRRYFQYFATAALAAEIDGDAWSFGYPRPDRSPFLSKLEEIWQHLGDGQVGAQVGAPVQPKDDKVDVFAARMHCDRLPGFPIAAAQVATGKDANEKSLKGHLSAFKSRWFARQPVTELIAYMIVPFAKPDDKFVDDVRVFGNVLHRLRVPYRVADAASLVKRGATIEGYDQLRVAASWVTEYRRRTGTTA